MSFYTSRSALRWTLDPLLPFFSDGTLLHGIAGVFQAVQGSIMTLGSILKQEACAARNDNILAVSPPHFFLPPSSTFPSITSYELSAKAVICTHRLQVSESMYGP